MQKKIEIQASSLLEATQIAVAKLHVSEEKLFLNEIGENTYEALLDVNLALEGRKYLESILNSMGIEQFNIEVRTIGQESEIHYVIDSSKQFSYVHNLHNSIANSSPYPKLLNTSKMCFAEIDGKKSLISKHPISFLLTWHLALVTIDLFLVKPCTQSIALKL